MKHLRKILTFSVTILLLLVVMPVVTNAQMSKVKTVWVILMENHNWTGNNAGAPLVIQISKATRWPRMPMASCSIPRRTPSSISILRVTIPASRITCGWKQGPTSACSLILSPASLL